MRRSGVKPIFEPTSIALYGASAKEDSIGSILLRNLHLAGYKGRIYRINPKYKKIGSHKCYPSLKLVRKSVDLAIIATPASTVPNIISECGEMEVAGAIVISAGFAEAGESGRALERLTVKRARRAGIRFLGPNCLGVIRPSIGFNATFSHSNANEGRIALVSQSGALCTAILDWARPNNVGFSAVISTGTSADVGFGEILDYLIADPQTDSIMLYIEGVHQTRHFMSALRAAARAKPVVVMKSGRHEAGSRAAVSHTGAIVGSDDIFDAALKRAGVLRVPTFANFFSAAATLDSGVRCHGDRLAIVTNAGGPGVMAADECVNRNVTLAELGKETVERLDRALPPSWSHANPVDVLGDASPERYQEALLACIEDPGVDAVLAILTPQALSAPADVAEKLIVIASGSEKPIFTCWMGEPAVASSHAAFRENNIPSYRTPEAAVRAFAAIALYRDSQQQLLQVPEPLTRQSPPDVDSAKLIIESVLDERRKVLTLAESKALLAAFNVPVIKSIPAHSASDAVLLATEIGLPVAMKILSPDITHKTDVGGVATGDRNRAGGPQHLSENDRHGDRALPGRKDPGGGDRTDVAAPQRARVDDRCCQRCCVRPRDQFRPWRHHGGNFARPRGRTATVEPLSGAQPDCQYPGRTLSRIVSWFARRGHARTRGSAAAGIGNGVRVTLAQGTRPESRHRRR